MDAALGLLARLNPHDRQGNIATERLAQQLLNREMAEKVPADPIERYHGLPVVLCHQQKQGRRRMRLFVRHERLRAAPFLFSQFRDSAKRCPSHTASAGLCSKIRSSAARTSEQNNPKIAS